MDDRPEPPMHAKVLNETDPRVFALVFDTGEEPLEGLTRFAEEHALAACSFTAIGAFAAATLGYFDWERKDYLRTEVREQVEVLSLLGDVAFEGARHKLHAHVVLGRRDTSTCGGHLLGARVRPTLEVILTESPNYLRREHDAASGLALIRIGR